MRISEIKFERNWNLEIYSRIEDLKIKFDLIKGLRTGEIPISPKPLLLFSSLP